MPSKVQKTVLDIFITLVIQMAINDRHVIPLFKSIINILSRLYASLLFFTKPTYISARFLVTITQIIAKKLT